MYGRDDDNFLRGINNSLIGRDTPSWRLGRITAENADGLNAMISNGLRNMFPASSRTPARDEAFDNTLAGLTRWQREQIAASLREIERRVDRRPWLIRFLFP